MIKRSPAIANPNSPKSFWNPKCIPNVSNILMRMAGFDSDVGMLFPEMESYNINLNFQLSPGQTLTESISSKNGTWILLERMATVESLPSGPFMQPFRDLVSVSSYVVSDSSNTNITLIEEQPVSLVFGSGEWQAALFPETWSSINNRIFSVKNTSADRVVVNLGFKLSRVAPRVIY